MEEIEINIVEVSNSVKVVNLLPNPIHFDDGTVVPLLLFVYSKEGSRTTKC